MSVGEGEGIQRVIEVDGLDVGLVVVEEDALWGVVTAAGCDLAAGCDPDIRERRCPVTGAFKLCRSFSADDLRAS